MGRAAALGRRVRPAGWLAAGRCGACLRCRPPTATMTVWMTALARMCAVNAATAAAATSSSGSSGSTPGARGPKPHILFIVADDHGFHDCSFTGSRVHTPTIDRFRASGIALEQHYVQKVCSPTRTAIMTGRYPHRNGMRECDERPPHHLVSSSAGPQPTAPRTLF